jgi:hypothetical protein
LVLIGLNGCAGGALRPRTAVLSPLSLAADVTSASMYPTI